MDPFSGSPLSSSPSNGGLEINSPDFIFKNSAFGSEEPLNDCAPPPDGFGGSNTETALALKISAFGSEEPLIDCGSPLDGVGDNNTDSSNGAKKKTPVITVKE